MKDEKGTNDKGKAYFACFLRLLLLLLVWCSLEISLRGVLLAPTRQDDGHRNDGLTEVGLGHKS